MLTCLRKLHSYGISHLDIKLENFVLNDDFTISFIDFGHSQDIDLPVTRKIGTKDLLAPEIQTPNLKIAISAEKVDVYVMGQAVNAIMKYKIKFQEYSLGDKFDLMY